MSIRIHILNANGKLSQLQHVIQKSSKSAIAHVIKSIPIDNVDIVFYESVQRIIEHLGFGGHAVTKNTIFIPINPSFLNLEMSFKENLSRTIAHELYHCLRNFTAEGKHTLLEALVNEGLADHFGIEITGKEPEKWDTALTKVQFKKLYKQAEKEFDNSTYNHWAWFFGSQKEGIPRWSGYTIGFAIVGDYLKKHPDQKPSNLYKAEAKEFI